MKPHEAAEVKAARAAYEAAIATQKAAAMQVRETSDAYAEAYQRAAGGPRVGDVISWEQGGRSSKTHKRRRMKITKLYLHAPGSDMFPPSIEYAGVAIRADGSEGEPLTLRRYSRGYATIKREN